MQQMLWDEHQSSSQDQADYNVTHMTSKQMVMKKLIVGTIHVQNQSIKVFMQSLLKYASRPSQLSNCKEQMQQIHKGNSTWKVNQHKQ